MGGLTTLAVASVLASVPFADDTDVAVAGCSLVLVVVAPGFAVGTVGGDVDGGVTLGADVTAGCGVTTAGGL